MSGFKDKNHILIDTDSQSPHTLVVNDNDDHKPVANVTTDDNVINNDNSTNKSRPPFSSAAPTPSSSKPLSTKPKLTKSKPRSPSPSPPPAPPPPPPPKTIRLEIKLGGPDNYEVDIANMAKATGQRPPTPVPIKPDTSDSEGDDDDNASTNKPKKRKKKSTAAEYYDISDPFIDDSELALDERTFFAQTKQQGFYVSSGEVALLKDKSPKKPKSKKHLPTDPSSSLLLSIPASQRKKLANGTKDSPIPLSSDPDDDQNTLPRPLSNNQNIKKNADHPKPDDGECSISGINLLGQEEVGQKKRKYVVLYEGGKRKKVIDTTSFHPDLQESFSKLKDAIAKENWEVKGKFPPAIKPLLSSTAMQAIKLGEYDEHFFNVMPVLFPYNKFTMSKLIKRTVFAEHTQLLVDQQDQLLEQLTIQAKEGFAKAEEEWEKSVLAWDKRQEKARLEAEASSVGGDQHGGAESSRTQTEEPMDVDLPSHQVHTSKPPSTHEGQEGGSAGGTHTTKELHPPAKKYRLTDSMKSIIWQLVLLSNECCRLENEKNSLEGSGSQVSEQGLRKVLYQKIVAAFPLGWMSSGQISREVSAMKKRFEKEAMENEA